MSGTRAYSAAHKAYVQLLYKRYCKNAFDLGGNMLKWRYDVMDIRNRFEANRDVLNPRALARLLAQAEDELKKIQHPAPYIPPNQPEGTAWYVSPVCIACRTLTSTQGPRPSRAHELDPRGFRGRQPQAFRVLEETLNVLCFRLCMF